MATKQHKGRPPYKKEAEELRQSNNQLAERNSRLQFEVSKHEGARQDEARLGNRVRELIQLYDRVTEEANEAGLALMVEKLPVVGHKPVPGSPGHFRPALGHKLSFFLVRAVGQ